MKRKVNLSKLIYSNWIRHAAFEREWKGRGANQAFDLQEMCIDNLKKNLRAVYIVAQQVESYPMLVY